MRFFVDPAAGARLPFSRVRQKNTRNFSFGLRRASVGARSRNSWETGCGFLQRTSSGEGCGTGLPTSEERRRREGKEGNVHTRRRGGEERDGIYGVSVSGSTLGWAGWARGANAVGDLEAGGDESLRRGGTPGGGRLSGQGTSGRRSTVRVLRARLRCAQGGASSGGQSC